MQVPISDSSWKIMTVRELTCPCGHPGYSEVRAGPLDGPRAPQSPLSPLGLHCPHSPVRLYL